MGINLKKNYLDYLCHFDAFNNRMKMFWVQVGFNKVNLFTLDVFFCKKMYVKVPKTGYKCKIQKTL